MRRRLAALLATFLLAASPALACSPAPGWPDKAHVLSDRAARQMVETAASIDVVVVEGLTPDFEVGTRKWAEMRAAPEGSYLRNAADGWLKGTREAWAEDGARIHFRVVQHLKGKSQEQFTLNGSKPLAPFAGQLPAPRAVALDQLQFFLNFADLVDGPQMGDCTVAVVGELGRMYLVFRDADGFPLRTEVPVRFHGRVAMLAGPSFVPILSINDAWPKLVVKSLLQRR